MKKLLIILITYLFFNSLLFAALTGSGTFADPYTGTVDSTITWTLSQFPTGQVYVTGITINSGYTLTIGPGVSVSTRAGGYMTISGTLDIGPGAGYTSRNITNNSGGILRLNSDASGIASLIISSGYAYSGAGTFETEVYLTGGTTVTGAPRWHYISSPVNLIPTNIFTANPVTMNLARYVENLVTTNDNTRGWVAFDGYVYNPVGQNDTYRFDGIGLELGRGYNYYCAENATRIITGTPNYNNVDVTLRCGSGYPDNQGFNLIGNPFSSSIDWDLIYLDLPPEVNDAIYFTTENRNASYVSGVSTGNGSNIIVPMQGFFVKVNTPASSVVLTLPATARVHNLSQIRFKGYSEVSERSSSIPLVRLKFENQSTSDDAVVRFDNEATTGVDKKFDAYKFSKTDGEINVWTLTDSVEYSINGLPFPQTTLDVPVVINAKTGGTFKLSSNELNKLDNYSVILKDLSTNKTVDLKKNEFIEFNAPAGITKDRFVLTVTNISTGIPEVPLAGKKFSVYSTSGIINILSLTDQFSNTTGTVTVYDLTGRKVFQENNVSWYNNGDLKQITLNSVREGLYIVEIRSGSMKYVEKVILRQ